MSKANAARREEAGEAPASRSDIVLVGRVKREAQKPANEGTPFAALTVETEVPVGDDDRPERLFHDVCGFGEVARHLAKAFDLDDLVRVTGRLSYKAGREDGSPRHHRVIVAGAESITTVESDARHVTEVEVVGTVSGIHSGAKKTPFFRAEVTATIARDDGEGTVEIVHKVLAFDRAAVMATDLALRDGEVVVVNGRLNRSATDKSRSQYEPVVFVDDLAGSIARAV